MQRRMVPRRLQIVDSLLDLDVDSREADAVRLRRAHLARYAKMAMVGALSICVAACLRVTASAIAEPETDGVAAAAVVAPPNGADTSAKPLPTPAAEELPSATERLKLVAVAKRARR